MIYFIRRTKTFRYDPAVRESIMEVGLNRAATATSAASTSLSKSIQRRASCNKPIDQEQQQPAAGNLAAVAARRETATADTDLPGDLRRRCCVTWEVEA